MPRSLGQADCAAQEHSYVSPRIVPSWNNYFEAGFIWKSLRFNERKTREKSIGSFSCPLRHSNDLALTRFAFLACDVKVMTAQKIHQFRSVRSEPKKKSQVVDSVIG